jgi:purine nucleosidase
MNPPFGCELMIKIHLDTDLGGDIDDLCALALLLRSPDVDLRGITVNSDSNGKRTGYVRYVLKLEGRSDIPVADGAEVSQGFYRYSELPLPKEEKYWPEPIPASWNPWEEALRLMKKNIEGGATVVGIGTYTNFCLLDTQFPGILKEAKLFLMGGYVYPPRPGFPDWKSEFDWNVQTDIRAARHILENSSPTLVPISVTAETALRKAHLEKLRPAGALGCLLARQAEAFALDEKVAEKYKNCENLPKDIINFQHDPLTTAIAFGWSDGVEIKEVPLVVQEKEGWLYERIDHDGKPTKIVTAIDGPRFNEFWLNRIISA